MSLIAITRKLAGDVGKIAFVPPVEYVYNPAVYAREPYEMYLQRYGEGPREIVLVGMNPGPWGMVQTGIPFGDVTMVREWLHIEGTVGRPERMHPRRPVDGFACSRREVSGRRLWGWAREHFGTPQRFFRRFFVANYCPLCFFDKEGRNITPDRLPSEQKEPLLTICDAALLRVLETMRPRWVFGIGRFAESRVRRIAPQAGARSAGLLHPSPANPKANRGWEAAVGQSFDELGITIP